MTYYPKRTVEELGQIRDMIAAGRTSAEVAEAIGTSQKSVLALALHHKLGTWKHYHGRFERPSREALEEAMRGRTGYHVAEKYGVSAKTVYSWCRSYDIPLRPGKRLPKVPPAATRDKLPETLTYAFSLKSEVYIRDTSPAGLAAEFFRRDREVIHCDHAGKPCQGGKFWRCGGRIMTDAEIIDAAAEKKARDARLFGRAA